MTVIASIERSKLSVMLRALHELQHHVVYQLEELCSEDDDRMRKEHIDLMTMMSNNVWTHTLPAVCIGFGACSFPASWQHWRTR